MKNIIVANWKLNPLTKEESIKLFDAIENGVDNNNSDIVICPPFIFLSVLGESKNIKLGAQNCFWEKKGAFTGEISPEMLKDLGCEFVIIGHSERRQYFNETDEVINKKLKAAIGAGLKPILCVGETESQREVGETDEVIAKQIIEGLTGILEEEFKNIIIAYEPVWAIGTGNACEAEEANRMAETIRKVVAKTYSKKVSENLPILYGGSVNSDNSKKYINQTEINGFLVGGASLKAEEFLKIINDAR